MSEERYLCPQCGTMNNGLRQRIAELEGELVAVRRDEAQARRDRRIVKNSLLAERVTLARVKERFNNYRKEYYTSPTGEFLNLAAILASTPKPLAVVEVEAFAGEPANFIIIDGAPVLVGGRSSVTVIVLGKERGE